LLFALVHLPLALLTLLHAALPLHLSSAHLLPVLSAALVSLLASRIAPISFMLLLLLRSALVVLLSALVSLALAHSAAALHLSSSAATTLHLTLLSLLLIAFWRDISGFSNHFCNLFYELSQDLHYVPECSS
jgi:hypothetical protein